MTPMLEMNHVSKLYGEHHALKDLSFQVHEGEILCFLGPNGAGKSTAIHILSTVLSYNEGRISFRGTRVEEQLSHYKRKLGIVPQDLAIYEDVTAEGNVTFFASLYGLRGDMLRERVAEALQFVGLYDRRGDKPRTFSGGMKRRLNMACAIAHRPEILIMDEPTVGIDPHSRNHILESIRELRDQGSTILYTTHYMEEVEEISTRILIIDQGEVIASGTKEELKELLGDEKWIEVELEDASELSEERLFRVDGVKQVEKHDNLLRIATVKGIENTDKLMAFFVNHGIKVKHFTSLAASLEAVFLQLTGRKLRD
ncbi:ABC transporter ATP-binding protein [Paenibacillus profundus]|uniref:ABC transporter ATP-binding protein n=1 Tax=Paenibacillus profundus TaxID=1173085 RepID=A0ABS8YBR8_9BACL|nr:MULTISPECIES: ABC transporter ATP-binding protein [Paenibacillus]MCE5168417.1 ABC transporter ATP-binding protein [Paenibacillus profundus]